ncbi:MAG: VOC family protein [Microgenomates group bacterium]
MQKIVPNLWFSGNASEAVDFYCSVFKDSKSITTTYYPQEGLLDFQKNLAGKVLTIDFELHGQRFVAINAGDEFKFTEAVSLAVSCKNQEEIDYFWSKLSADPSVEQCGWCKDKYGLSWQIVPENVEELMKKPGGFEVMMRQKKIIIDEY